MVVLIRVEPHLKKKCFIFKKNGLKIRGVTTWYQSVRCENLGLWGDFCLDGLHLIFGFMAFGIHVHEYWNCIDIDP